MGGLTISAVLGCGPTDTPADTGSAMDVTAPSDVDETMDVRATDGSDSDGDPGCCPIGRTHECGCTPYGGWAGRGCSNICDLGANMIAMDDHGCPYLVNTGICNCLCRYDAGMGDATADEPDAPVDGGEP